MPWILVFFRILQTHSLHFWKKSGRIYKRTSKSIQRKKLPSSYFGLAFYCQMMFHCRGSGWAFSGRIAQRIRVSLCWKSNLLYSIKRRKTKTRICYTFHNAVIKLILLLYFISLRCTEMYSYKNKDKDRLPIFLYL